MGDKWVMELLDFIDIVMKLRITSLMFYFKITCDMLLDLDGLGQAMS